MEGIPEIGIFVISPRYNSPNPIPEDCMAHDSLPPDFVEYVPKLGFYASSFLYGRVTIQDPDNTSEPLISNPLLFSAAVMNGRLLSLRNVQQTIDAFTDYLTEIRRLNPQHLSVDVTSAGILKLTGAHFILRQFEEYSTGSELVDFLNPYTEKNGLLLIIDGKAVINKKKTHK